MPKQAKGIQWVRGSWANRGYMTSRSTPDLPMAQATADLLTKLNPNTPIDPEGYVGFWEVPNRPNEWQVWQVTVYHGEPGKSSNYKVVLNPLLHLKWVDRQDTSMAIISQLFRVGKKEFSIWREDSPKYCGISWQVFSKTRQR